MVSDYCNCYQTCVHHVTDRCRTVHPKINRDVSVPHTCTNSKPFHVGRHAVFLTPLETYRWSVDRYRRWLGRVFGPFHSDLVRRTQLGDYVYVLRAMQNSSGITAREHIQLRWGVFEPMRVICWKLLSIAFGITLNKKFLVFCLEFTKKHCGPLFSSVLNITYSVTT